MAKPERCFRGLTGPGRLLSSTNIAKGPAMANGKHRFLLPFAEPPACPVFRCVACCCDKKCRFCVSSPGLFVENAACVCCGIVYFLIFRGAGLACRLRMRRFRAGKSCFFRLKLFLSACYSFFPAIVFRSGCLSFRVRHVGSPAAFLTGLLYMIPHFKA